MEGNSCSVSQQSLETLLWQTLNVFNEAQLFKTLELLPYSLVGLPD